MSLLAQVTIIEKLFPKDLIWNNRWVKLLNLLTSKLKSLKNGVLINQPANSYPQGEDNKPFSNSQGLQTYYILKQ